MAIADPVARVLHPTNGPAERQRAAHPARTDHVPSVGHVPKVAAAPVLPAPRVGPKRADRVRKDREANADGVIAAAVVAVGAVARRDPEGHRPPAHPLQRDAGGGVDHGDRPAVGRVRRLCGAQF